MTIEEAAEAVGKRVRYDVANRYGANEQGTITSTSRSYVFVQFDGQKRGVACDPGDLELTGDEGWLI